MEQTSDRYPLTYDDKVVIHLGRQMYGTVSAAIAELVANSWDAGASGVSITIESENVSIQDDGQGMNLSDIKDRYLNVGYNRRDSYSNSQNDKRPVMGRKGIGKFSAFTVSDHILVETWTGNSNDDVEAFEMSYNEELKKPCNIFDKREESGYKTKGTKISFSKRKGKRISFDSIEKELTKRFLPILGNNFDISVNEKKLSITILDSLFSLSDVALIIGKETKHPFNEEEVEIKFAEDTSSEHIISGWLAGIKERSEETRGGNKISLIARGRVIVEDILPEVTDNTIFANSYIFGHITADFCDEDNMPDMATSDRQKLNKDDERYLPLIDAVKKQVVAIVNMIQKKREKSLQAKLAEDIAYQNYIAGMDASEKKIAEKLLKAVSHTNLDFGKKQSLLYNVLLGFEEVKLRKEEPDWDKITPQNIEIFSEFFASLESFEAFRMHPVISKKLEVIGALRELLSKDTKEDKFQEVIATNLWLVTNKRYGAQGLDYSIKEVIEQLCAPDSKQRNFIDIFISKDEDNSSPIIIELKRRDRVKKNPLRYTDIMAQVERYREALKKHTFIKDNVHLNAYLKDHYLDEIRGIILVENLVGDDNPETYKRSRKSALEAGITILTYSEIIKNAERYFHELEELLNKKYPNFERIEKLIQSRDESQKNNLSE